MRHNLYQKIQINQGVIPDGLLDTKPRGQRGQSLCFKVLERSFHTID